MNLGWLKPEHRQHRGWHWPTYTKGCWGKPGVPKCLLCRIRFGWWHLKGLI